MKPGLLVASPQMLDPFFGRTAILLCEYNKDGAMGLVLNRPLDITLETVLEQLKLPMPTPVTDQVLWGGPVMPEAGFLLCRGQAAAQTEPILKVTDDLFVSTSRTMLSRAATGELERPFYLCLGYAGWGAAQLDAEIERGTWIYLDLDEEIIFSTALDDRWRKCIESLGVATEQIWMSKPISE